MAIKAYNETGVTLSTRSNGVITIGRECAATVIGISQDYIMRGIDHNILTQKFVVDGFIPLEDILFDEYQIAYFDTTSLADLDTQTFRAKYGGGS